MNISKIYSAPAFKGYVNVAATNNVTKSPAQIEKIDADVTVFTQINKLKDGTELLIKDHFGLYIPQSEASFQDVLSALIYSKLTKADIDLSTYKDCSIKDVQRVGEWNHGTCKWNNGICITS